MLTAVNPENVEKNKAMNAWTLKVREKITVHGENFKKKISLTLRKKECRYFLNFEYIGILIKMPKE